MEGEIPILLSYYDDSTKVAQIVERVGKTENPISF
jgi:hypothetical protein